MTILTHTPKVESFATEQGKVEVFIQHVALDENNEASLHCYFNNTDGGIAFSSDCKADIEAMQFIKGVLSDAENPLGVDWAYNFKDTSVCYSGVDILISHNGDSFTLIVDNELTRETNLKITKMLQCITQFLIRGGSLSGQNAA